VQNDYLFGNCSSERYWDVTKNGGKRSQTHCEEKRECQIEGGEKKRKVKKLRKEGGGRGKKKSFGGESNRIY